jgi:hypothetical protein
MPSRALVVTSISGEGERIEKSIAPLLRRELIEQVPVTDRARAWREEDQQFVGLVIASAGRAIIGADERQDEVAPGLGFVVFLVGSIGWCLVAVSGSVCSFEGCHPVKILNLSGDGAKVHIGAPLRTNAQVILRYEGMDHAALVKWRRGRNFGLKFTADPDQSH